MSLLNLTSQTLAFGDVAPNSNPSLRYFDWKRCIQGIAVDNPKGEKFVLDPGSTTVIFNGTRSTTFDGTTQLTLTASPTDPNSYRFTFSSGTDPAFRTNRNLALNTTTQTITVNLNNSITMASSAADLGAVQIGDQVYIPSTQDLGAPSPFNSVNWGLWQVIGNGASSLTLIRLSGEPFSGISEVVPITANTQVQAFSATGVQIGDMVDISSGFAVPVLKSYEVTAVTATYFDVESTVALAPQANIMVGSTGVQFYTNAKRYLRLEADQECAVRANGDTGNSQRISPWSPGDQDLIGEYTKTGPTWSLSVVNRSTVPLNLTVISAE